MTQFIAGFLAAIGLILVTTLIYTCFFDDVDKGEKK